MKSEIVLLVAALVAVVCGEVHFTEDFSDGKSFVHASLLDEYRFFSSLCVYVPLILGGERSMYR